MITAGRIIDRAVNQGHYLVEDTPVNHAYLKSQGIYETVNTCLGPST
jgi:hypothetical protein